MSKISALKKIIGKGDEFLSNPLNRDTLSLGGGIAVGAGLADQALRGFQKDKNPSYLDMIAGTGGGAAVGGALGAGLKKSMIPGSALKGGLGGAAVGGTIGLLSSLLQNKIRKDAFPHKIKPKDMTDEEAYHFKMANDIPLGWREQHIHDKLQKAMKKKGS